MKQLALSDDLIEITAEINIWKQQAGQAVFEIGRRLKHVKENDLVHGQWIPFLESIEITHSTAKRMIQAFEQFGNSATSHHLDTSKIFEMLSLPETIDRQEFTTTPHIVPSTGEIKTVYDMTVKELREVKKALQEVENKARHFESLWNQTKNQPVRIETKTVEIAPTDYNFLKQQANKASEVSSENVALHRQIMELKSDFSEKITQRDETQHNAKKLKECFKNILSAVNQEQYNAKFFYSQIEGSPEAHQAIESFMNEFSMLVNDLFIEWKDQIQVKVS